MQAMACNSNGPFSYDSVSQDYWQTMLLLSHVTESFKPNRAPASKRMWAWSIKRVANVWQNCIEINGKGGPVVSTVLALPMPPWKRCSKFLEH